MIEVGIIGGAGYTAGELIRLLLNHPKARLNFVYSTSSSGSNICGQTMGTSNDMPIVHPPSFDALSIIPFNINPHYLDPNPNNCLWWFPNLEYIAQKENLKHLLFWMYWNISFFVPIRDFFLQNVMVRICLL